VHGKNILDFIVYYEVGCVTPQSSCNALNGILKKFTITYNFYYFDGDKYYSKTSGFINV